MRRSLFTMACALSIAAAGTSATLAGPLTGAGIPSLQTGTSNIQEARIFCYNKASGRFLHWGYCGYQPVNHPRIYCRNTYTGQFLHWGSCY